MRVGNRIDIAVGFFTEICFVSDLGMLVVVAGENTLASSSFKRDTESANPAEQVNELELATTIASVRPIYGDILANLVAGGLRRPSWFSEFLCHADSLSKRCGVCVIPES